MVIVKGELVLNPFKPRVLPGLNEYAVWLDQVEYLNAEFSFEECNDILVLLKITMVRPPAPGTPAHMIGAEAFVVNSYHQIPFGLDRDGFIERVYLGVLFAEEHECAEFFLVDGDQPFHPHRVGFKSRINRPRRMIA